MKLIIGLGNPGQSYASTRHNVGFMIVEAFAKKYRAEFSPKPKYKAEIAECTIDNEKVLILKPQTYYNLSGEAVQLAAHFYKLTVNDILIIHDELVLPLGTLRTRVGGSGAGNNGVKSIGAHIGYGTNRLRIGTRGEYYSHAPDTEYVLGEFTRAEAAQLAELQPTIFHLIDGFIRGEFRPTTITDTQK